MIQVSKEHPIYKYDDDFDVMHVHYADRWNSSVIEDYPGILVHYDDTTDECTGFTVMDYKNQIGGYTDIDTDIKKRLTL